MNFKIGFLGVLKSSWLFEYPLSNIDHFVTLLFYLLKKRDVFGKAGFFLKPVFDNTASAS